ncbi:heat shock protein GrpE [Klebsormidium nitens]|uniref:GrpE protein homolog n=1 Tax=Klebsormidium nitens TaxID=105231 RepID=A0A0U9HIU6_KLENI|nr:heat shock protein GrpE [Klebsormidium nitens]|eukprot:GAQ77970.1 heat shock protein GrpE [Klebsormidium nitens]
MALSTACQAVSRGSLTGLLVPTQFKAARTQALPSSPCQRFASKEVSRLTSLPLLRGTAKVAFGWGKGQAKAPRELKVLAVSEETEEAKAVEAEEEAEAPEEETAEVQDEPGKMTQLLRAYRDAVVADDEDVAEALEEQLRALEGSSSSSRAEELTKEMEVLKDRYLRLNADFDNFRKRSDREKASLASSVRGDVIEELLPMIDNFERARDAVKASTEGEQKIDASYQGIYKQFVDILKKLGIVPVPGAGTPFDPAVHEAIMQEESNEYAEGIVTQEFRKGFQIGEKLLRPAMVKVSSGPGPASKKNGSD